MTGALRSGPLLLALGLLGCLPSPRSGRDEPSTPPQVIDASPADADETEGGVAEGGVADGGVADAAESPAPPEPAGEVVGRGTLDGGGDLRVEAMDGGFGFRLTAAPDAGLALEPIARLEGPGSAGAYFGPRCPSAAADQARLIGRWSGELTHCATQPQPMALMEGQDQRPGCPLRPAPPGTWALTVYRCGYYGAPLGRVSFEISAPPDAGPPDARP